MKNDKIAKAIQEHYKEYGFVIEWTLIGQSKNTAYFHSVRIWTLPPFLFHLLRKTATLFDRLADKVRALIEKHTIEKDQIMYKEVKKTKS